MRKLILLISLLMSVDFVQADQILSDLQFFERTGIPILKTHPTLPFAIGVLPADQEEHIHTKVHEMGRCGGFERVDESFQIQDLRPLEVTLQNDRVQTFLGKTISINKDENIAHLSDQVSAEHLQEWVTWMEAFGTRSHRAREPNRPVLALEQKLKELLKSASVPFEVTLIDHGRTPQKSVRVRLIGKTEPTRKIILGAHFDSISGWFSEDAPGADDNASGSSNLLEVLRILSTQPQMNRTVEFYWYAGEEGGLIGSSEIARSYRDQSENVLAVMQLDMTLFPGDGPFKLGLVTDFTTPWVREFLKGLNQTYFKYEISEFECGYGCSDHASWYRNSYHTVAPFEARMRTMNPDIHTPRDRIKPSYNFEHSAAFSKLALVFALELDRYNP